MPLGDLFESLARATMNEGKRSEKKAKVCAAPEPRPGRSRQPTIDRRDRRGGRGGEREAASSAGTMCRVRAVGRRSTRVKNEEERAK